MLPLIVWAAGCVFGLWCIWHWGFYREAIAFCVCGSTLLWMVGGASWLGKQLAAARQLKREQRNPGAHLKGLNTDAADLEALRKAAERQSASTSP